VGGSKKKKKKKTTPKTNHNNTREQEINTKVIHNSKLGIIQGHGDIPDIETKPSRSGEKKKKKKKKKKRRRKETTLQAGHVA